MPLTALPLKNIYYLLLIKSTPHKVRSYSYIQLSLNLSQLYVIVYNLASLQNPSLFYSTLPIT